MRRWLVTGVATALSCLLVAPAAAAANDPDGIFTGYDSATWQSYTYEQYMADAKVADISRVMSSVASDSFRAKITQEMEGDYSTDEYVYSKGVTRIAAKDYSGRRTVTYVKGNRQCQRKAASKKDFGIESDTPERFTCGKTSSDALNGQEVAAGLLPQRQYGDKGSSRYLLSLTPTAIKKGELAALEVIVVSASDLKDYGLVKAPSVNSFRYWIGPDTIGKDEYNGNPYSSSHVWAQLWSTDVPALPKAMRRAVNS